MLVKNIPPVPEGFDPDSVQLGLIPMGEKHAYYHMMEDRWYQGGHTGFRRIFCLPLKPWYPPSWYDSNGDLLPDVYEHDPKKWPEHVGPLDEVGLLFDIERREKSYSGHTYTAGRIGYWDKTVAYRIVKRHNQSSI